MRDLIYMGIDKEKQGWGVMWLDGIIAELDKKREELVDVKAEGLQAVVTCIEVNSFTLGSIISSVGLRVIQNFLNETF